MNMRIICIIFLFSTFFIIKPVISQQKIIDSLLTINKKTRIDSIKLNTLFSLTDLYSFKNTDSSIYFGKKAVILSKRLKDDTYLSHALNELGWAYYVSGDYTTALSNFLEALKIYEKNKDTINISSVYGNIGSVYLNQKNNQKARTFYIKALVLDEKNSKRKWLASDLSNVGITYTNEKNYNKALQFYKAALNINREIRNKRDESMNLGNIANLYNNLSGENSFSANQRDSMYLLAAEYYQKALTIDFELDRKVGIAIKLGNLGELFTKMKKYQQAEIYLKRAISLSDSIGIVDIIDNWYKNLSNLYEEMNNPSEAFFHFKKFKAIKDSVNSILTIQNSLKLEMEYKFDKEQAILKAEQEKRPDRQRKDP